MFPNRKLNTKSSKFQKSSDQFTCISCHCFSILLVIPAEKITYIHTKFKTQSKDLDQSLIATCRKVNLHMKFILKKGHLWCLKKFSIVNPNPPPLLDLVLKHYPLFTLSKFCKTLPKSNPHNQNDWFWGCLDEKNHPTQVRRLIWVRSWQNGVFHFVKTNRLHQNGFIHPSEISPQRRWSHLGEMIFPQFLQGCRTYISRAFIYLV